MLNATHKAAKNTAPLAEITTKKKKKQKTTSARIQQFITFEKSI